jgi:hypothetical protein
MIPIFDFWFLWWCDSIQFLFESHFKLIRPITGEGFW